MPTFAANRPEVVRRGTRLAPAAAVLSLAVGASGAHASPPADKVTVHRWDARQVVYHELGERLAKTRKASVSLACGSTAAPWAYRGTRGKATTLRSYRTAAADEAWTHRFLATLLRPADWDSVTRCSGVNRRCDEPMGSPLIVVTLEGRPDAYVLLMADSPCAILFEADRPLGALRLGERFDSLFVLLGEALPEIASVRSTPMPVPAEVDRGPAIGANPIVDVLPDVVKKVKPFYPEEALKAGTWGTVQVMALVGRAGAVRDAFVLTSVPGLDDAALASVWDWTFKPARANGAPVAVWVVVPVKFTIH